jgi:hypothetical protein
LSERQRKKQLKEKFNNINKLNIGNKSKKNLKQKEKTLSKQGKNLEVLQKLNLLSPDAREA